MGNDPYCLIKEEKTSREELISHGKINEGDMLRTSGHMEAAGGKEFRDGT